jgi:NADPH-dependent curcumin reductase CurA
VTDAPVATTQRVIKMASHPAGTVKESDFELVEAPVPEPADGEALVRTLYLSLDPAIRVWMNGVDTYVPGIHVGEAMRGGAIGEVVQSRSPNYQVGDLVLGMIDWSDYAIAGSGPDGMMAVPRQDPVTAYLSVYGVTGLTAYFGMTDVGETKEGDTVVVSGAAGAVGSIAGQIGKILGCRVVGIAGGPEKCAWLTDELGFDAWIDYKSDDVGARLRETCPDGIDVFFDNVGGDILDAALANLAWGARVVICGAISQYNAEGGMRGPSNYMMLLVRRARMQGFLVFDYAKQYGDALGEMAGWRNDGTLKTREAIVEGSIEDFQPTLMQLFRGDNTGKLVLQIAAP